MLIASILFHFCPSFLKPKVAYITDRKIAEVNLSAFVWQLYEDFSSIVPSIEEKY